jgi:hypothetical protein
MANDYAVKLYVDYPDKSLNKLTTFFRVFVAIPILIILGLLVGGSYSQGGAWTWQSGIGIVMVPTVCMLLFRRKYPRWWFDWNLALSRLSTRVFVFLFLMRDEYPSTDEEQAVHLELVYPDAGRDLNRWLPLVKWIMAIPHYIVLFCLLAAVYVVTICAWFAILFTGRYPRSMFDFVQGVVRWDIRVSAYAFLLITDKYPPFSLDA